MFREASAVDQRRRLVGWRQLATPGVVAIVGLDETESMSTLDAQQASARWISALASALAAVLVVIAVLESVRRARQDLERRVAERTATSRGDRRSRSVPGSPCRQPSATAGGTGTGAARQLGDRCRVRAARLVPAVLPDLRARPGDGVAVVRRVHRRGAFRRPGVVDRAFEQSRNDRTAYDIEHRLQLPDGRIKWVRECGRTEYDAAGRPCALDGHGAGRHAVSARRGGRAARPRQGGGRGRQPGEEQLPGQHEPRDPHADERHPRAWPTCCARDGVDAAAGRAARQDRRRRRGTCWHHQRHPRPLQDRGRQASSWKQATSRSPDCSAGHRGRRSATGAAPRACAAASTSAGMPHGAARRRHPAAAGAAQLSSATRSSSPSAAASRCAAACSRRRRTAALLRFEVADTGIGIPAESARPAVPAVRAGRRLDHAPLRRHRPGPRDHRSASRS